MAVDLSFDYREHYLGPKPSCRALRTYLATSIPEYRPNEQSSRTETLPAVPALDAESTSYRSCARIHGLYNPTIFGHMDSVA